jgi:hypothetical protein
MKYAPFQIFWCIFCRNLRKIQYENEVCFEACRMPNFFLTVLRFFEKIMNYFQIHHNFQLVYILSFQKRYICPKKILDIKKIFKKTWSQISLFSPNFDFGAQISHEIFKISNPNFSHVIYN